MHRLTMNGWSCFSIHLSNSSLIDRHFLLFFFVWQTAQPLKRELPSRGFLHFVPPSPCNSKVKFSSAELVSKNSLHYATCKHPKTLTLNTNCDFLFARVHHTMPSLYATLQSHRRPYGNFLLGAAFVAIRFNQYLLVNLCR
jgi:hypothetical protein